MFHLLVLTDKRPCHQKILSPQKSTIWNARICNMHMEVSWNRGTLKSSLLIVFFHCKPSNWGYHHFRNSPNLPQCFCISHMFAPPCGCPPQDGPQRGRHRHRRLGFRPRAPGYIDGAFRCHLSHGLAGWPQEGGLEGALESLAVKDGGGQTVEGWGCCWWCVFLFFCSSWDWSAKTKVVDT